MEKRIRILWAENADYISKQYTGTNSTITDLTKTETKGIKGTIKHKMTSVERFFKNNIFSSDDSKQECIELVKGSHEKSHSIKGKCI